MPHFGERLKSARRIKGWSLQDLANYAAHAVSKQALSKYETEAMMPSRKILLLLCTALDVTPNYFETQPVFKLPVFELRKNTLPVKQAESIKEKVKRAMELYLQTENLLNIKTRFSNPIRPIPVPDEEAAADIADKLRDKWDLGRGALHNVIGMLENRGIRVIQVTSPAIFDGVSTYVGRAPVIVLHEERPADIKRYAAMYELGQLLLNIPENADRHKLCEIFARTMLLPGDTLGILLSYKRQAISPGELLCVKEQYGLPMQAVMHQAIFKGIIDKKNAQPFFKLIADNKDETGLGNYMGTEKNYRFDRMLGRLVIEEIIDLEKALELTGMSAEELQKKVELFEPAPQEAV
ncbi:helix-turn-helix domain-containing protein [Chitinophaga sp. S165]|uniref:helix-turn-helix domain-containing protein n=1 Tax=Chitinophaga sp. S165 TaxID=2135462 RepID=UPI000D71C4A3|nr:XRE family transcriptional regulator [Chitinophaga sp. S165]PWV48122.1 Zn-dependent peptidase ImmA (M78 family) [Chitinophaga sp. S165]